MMEVMIINDVVERDWSFGEDVKMFWMRFLKFTSDIKSINEYGSSTYNLISETMK